MGCTRQFLSVGKQFVTIICQVLQVFHTSGAAFTIRLLFGGAVSTFSNGLFTAVSTTGVFLASTPASSDSSASSTVVANDSAAFGSLCSSTFASAGLFGGRRLMTLGTMATASFSKFRITGAASMTAAPALKNASSIVSEGPCFCTSGSGSRTFTTVFGGVCSRITRCICGFGFLVAGGVSLGIGIFLTSESVDHPTISFLLKYIVPSESFSSLSFHGIPGGGTPYGFQTSS